MREKDVCHHVSIRFYGHCEPQSEKLLNVKVNNVSGVADTRYGNKCTPTKELVHRSTVALDARKYNPRDCHCPGKPVKPGVGVARYRINIFGDIVPREDPVKNSETNCGGRHPQYSVDIRWKLDGTGVRFVQNPAQPDSSNVCVDSRPRSVVNVTRCWKRSFTKT